MRPDGTGPPRDHAPADPVAALAGSSRSTSPPTASRLLAEFVGQDTSVGFTVNPATGRTRSLSRNQETGFVAAAISKDGRPCSGRPAAPTRRVRKDVVTKPYKGGAPHRARARRGLPDWSR